MTEQEVESVKNQMTNLRDQLTATFEDGMNSLEKIYKRKSWYMFGVYVFMLALQHLALMYLAK